MGQSMLYRAVHHLPGGDGSGGGGGGGLGGGDLAGGFQPLRALSPAIGTADDGCRRESGLSISLPVYLGSRN
jgi:hypothetical protein